MPEQEIVQAQEILNKIKEGRNIDYENYIIKGDLDLNRLDISKDDKERKIIRVPIRIVKTRFDGKISFENAIFLESLTFLNVTFTKNVSFKASRMEGEADFSESKFIDKSDFREVIFARDADFRLSRFTGDACFSQSQFNQDAHFQFSDFRKEARFQYTYITGLAEFYYSNFESEADFLGSIFKEKCDFDDSTFNKNANFRRSSFQKSLSFINAEFNKIYIDWKSIRDIQRAFPPKLYLSLIENYKESGFFEEADFCYYEYRKESRQKLPTFFHKMLDFIFCLSYGYGVKPFRPLVLSIIIFYIYGCFYLIHMEIVGKTTNSPVLDAYNFSSVLFLSGAALIQAPSFNATGYIYWILVTEKLLGTLLLALFLISVARTIMR